ncbi:hypothetical protein Pcinc_002886 [Petrolisthes cinctipes]|uniref:Uncharacterized protein n=1 Tax=Petrolisthes cinctipes TaxID=88211 RepID=A0AAE1L1Q8_PETCI|nr:hypothetical protein Pcinc_002886 [Petrolisthes cinctipes]
MLEQKEREKRVNSIIIRGLGTDIDNLQDKFNELVSFLLPGILPSSSAKTLNFAAISAQPSSAMSDRPTSPPHRHILATTGTGAGRPPPGGPSPSVPNANPATTLPRSEVGDSNRLLSLDVSASVEGAEAATSPSTGPQAEAAAGLSQDCSPPKKTNPASWATS